MTVHASTLVCAAASDAGLARTANEDRFHCDPERGIFMVIDGMGGQAAGEQAAIIARDKICARLERATGTPAERLREAITLANNAIYEQAQTHPDWRGMACVLSVAIVEADRVVIGHVGDTRIYKLHKGQITKLTHDHSPIGIQEEQGRLAELEAMRHPRRNEVFRDVGSALHKPEDADFIEITEAAFEPGSALLLCSDGLSDLVTSAEIRQTVETHAASPAQAVAALIAAANQAGGHDNITVVLVAQADFAAALTVPVAKDRVSWRAQSRTCAVLRSRPVIFALGVLCGVLLLSLGQGRWQRAKAAEAGRTLVVNTDGSTGYATIGAALAAAAAGDTVLIEAGTYAEQLEWKAGVRVVNRQPLRVQILASVNDCDSLRGND
jgi:PPM family protein phosphatase